MLQQLFTAANVEVLHNFSTTLSFDESLAIKSFFNRIGFEYFRAPVSKGLALQQSLDFRKSFVCQIQLSDIDHISSNTIVLLINCNIKPTLPILETKLYQAYKNGASFFVIGAPILATYKFTHLGPDLRVLE